MAKEDRYHFHLKIRGSKGAENIGFNAADPVTAEEHAKKLVADYIGEGNTVTEAALECQNADWPKAYIVGNPADAEEGDDEEKPKAKKSKK